MIPRLYKVANQYGSGLDQTIIYNNTQKALNQHYAKLLAIAYKKATGKNLKDAYKHIDVRFGYVLGHAPNVSEQVLSKLDPESRSMLQAGYTEGYNVTPQLIADAVDSVNDSAYRPYKYDKDDIASYYRVKRPLRLKGLSPVLSKTVDIHKKDQQLSADMQKILKALT